jgi:hypothetical protein
MDRTLPRLTIGLNVVATLLALLICVPAGAAPAETAGATPPWARAHTRLSSSALRVLRDQYERGVPFAPALVERLGLDAEEFAEGTGDAPAAGVARPFRAARTATVALGLDRQVNDRSGDATCTSSPGCGGRPLAQAETTIASWGNFVLAGWNDTKGFCPPYGAVQGYGTSTDGGATWVDGGDVPTPIIGSRWRGDPVHAVNRKTGDFYIAGLFEKPTNSSFDPGSGMAFARGHFSGGSFVFDDNKQISTAGGTVSNPSFHDKEWIAADSLSGNIYITYSNYIDVNTDLAQIELLRSTTNGTTWEAPRVLSPLGNGQGSRPVVGPAGEVYVVWYEYDFPKSRLWVRKSTDFGATFAPAVQVVDFYENPYSGAPGFRRGGAVTLPGAAIDASTGPHRGRLYVTWDESVDFYDAPAPSGTAVGESENNAFFSRATPFAIGDILVGQIATTSDVDLYSFSGARGQTVFLRTNTAGGTGAFNMRLVCTADTSSFENYRYLAFDQSFYPAIAFTLPATGTYVLRMERASGSTPNAYTIQTSFDTPTPGERARDHRDRFVAHSDDGLTWSAPVRLNDDDPWFDGVFPEITVDGTGAAHCTWHDFRDDGCGAMSYEYLTSSGDGGVTWGANRRLSDAQSFWSVNACGSANQGDYQGVTSDGNAFRACWADSRLGDPDIFTEAPTFRHAASCALPAAANGGAAVNLSFSVDNTGSVGGSYQWTLADDNGWLTSATPSASGSVALAPSASQAVQGTFALPYGCTPAVVDTVRFSATDPNVPGRTLSCRTTITCASVLGVDPGTAGVFALAPPHPNPSAGEVTLGYTLPRGGAVRLVLYGARGERVRTLVSGERPAGAHAVTWDQRDERGRRVAPGLYYARLETDGRSLERPLAVVK